MGAFLKKYSKYIFLGIGFAILAALLYYVDLNVIGESFSIIGTNFVWVILISIVWIIPNVKAFSIVLGRDIPFYQLLYMQVVGDAYNVITPFAGLGGEPYKMKYLTNWISLSEASQTVVRDRLIHALSGITFTSIVLLIAVLFISLPTSVSLTFSILAVVLGILSFLFSLFIMSDKLNNILGKYLKKYDLFKEIKNNPFSKKTFFTALSYKMLGRFMGMAEIYVIFYFLHLPTEFLDILLVSAMLSLGSTLLFIIPSGIGVHEAGISGAFKLIGLPLDLGFSVGIIKRARVLLWALFGVGMHLLVLFARNLFLSGQKKERNS